MLDTDTVSYALRGQGRAASRILSHPPSALCLSSITLAELRYGADLRRSRKLHALIDHFIRPLTVAPFDSAAADRFGPVAAALAHAGAPIGGFDTLIAAHAIRLGLTLVTNNTKHFERVAGLRTENWV
jgi:tRNA(fMet)-specific endonuclease VapC